MKLQFKLWFESVFGSAGPGIDDRPASEFPNRIARSQGGGAFPTYDLEPLPNSRANKRNTYMKKQKKN